MNEIKLCLNDNNLKKLKDIVSSTNLNGLKIIGGTKDGFGNDITLQYEKNRLAYYSAFDKNQFR